MSRPLGVFILSAISLLPSALQAQDRGAIETAAFLPPANRQVNGRAAGTAFGGIASGPFVAFGVPYPNAPIAGAPYSLPPAPVFQPVVSHSNLLISTNQRSEFTRLDRDERITREVQRLRDDANRLPQAVQPRPESQPQRQSVEEPSQPVLLVFRDGRQMEVQGYAIVGETVWAVTGQTSNMIPLSDLDLEATQKQNANRGVQFPLPRKP